MAKQCQVCSHDEVNTINERLISGVLPQALADEFGLHYHAVWRHREKHLPLALTKAKQLQEIDAADNLLERVEAIHDQAWELMKKAEVDGKYQPAVSALKECRSCLELIGRLLGELKTGTTVNIHYNPQWVELKSTIYDCLKQYPEARLALVERLTEVEEVHDAEFNE